jgi:hypothetical protein
MANASTSNKTEMITFRLEKTTIATIQKIIDDSGENESVRSWIKNFLNTKLNNDDQALPYGLKKETIEIIQRRISKQGKGETMADYIKMCIDYQVNRSHHAKKQKSL